MNRLNIKTRNPDMLSVEEAREHILSECSVMESKATPLSEALGLVLDENIVSTIDLPASRCSRMDGYAVRCIDLINASSSNKVILTVMGAVSAGDITNAHIKSGYAVRVMTGAPVPDGADAVVPFEQTDEIENPKKAYEAYGIGFLHSPSPLENVQPIGESVKKNDVVLRKGIVITPSHISAAAAIGKSVVKAIRRPVVGVISTGNELVEPGMVLPPGKIYDSNSYGLHSFIIKSGGIPEMFGIVPDTLDAVRRSLMRAINSCDLVITSGGVSKGDYDFVKAVLEQEGKINFWSINMKPGKPLAFGLISRSDKTQVPHIGLPGNVVSTQVTFLQFAHYAIQKMLGMKIKRRPTVNAIMQTPIINYDGRRIYERVVVSQTDGEIVAKTTGNQSSSVILSMALANGLAICPEHVTKIEKGSQVEVELLDD